MAVRASKPWMTSFMSPKTAAPDRYATSLVGELHHEAPAGRTPSWRVIDFQQVLLAFESSEALRRRHGGKRCVHRHLGVRAAALGGKISRSQFASRTPPEPGR